MQRKYEQLIRDVLGPPRPLPTSPGAWRRLESRIGFSFPKDYKSFIDAYAPVVLKGHLYVEHPAVEFRDMGGWMSRTIESFGGADWDPEEHQFGMDGPIFGLPGGLYPLMCTDRGEVLFSKADANNVHEYLVVYEGSEDSFYEYHITFTEWLYSYLIGQDAMGPDSAITYTGPVKLERLPLEPGGELIVWYGPKASA